MRQIFFFRVRHLVASVIIAGVVMALFSPSAPINAQPGSLVITSSVDTDGDAIFSDAGATVNPGQTVTYGLNVSSTPGSRNDNTIVTGTLPPGTTYVPNSTTFDGGPVVDTGGLSPLMAGGFNVGQMGGGTMSQTTWQNGSGQGVFGDPARYANDNGNGDATSVPGEFRLRKSTGFEQDTVYSPLGEYVQVDANTNGFFSTRSTRMQSLELNNGNTLLYNWHGITDDLIHGYVAEVIGPDGSVVVPPTVLKLQFGNSFPILSEVVKTNFGFALLTHLYSSLSNTYGITLDTFDFSLSQISSTPIDVSFCTIICTHPRIFPESELITYDASSDVIYVVWVSNFPGSRSFPASQTILMSAFQGSGLTPSFENEPVEVTGGGIISTLTIAHNSSNGLAVAWYTDELLPVGSIKGSTYETSAVCGGCTIPPTLVSGPQFLSDQVTPVYYGPSMDVAQDDGFVVVWSQEPDKVASAFVSPAGVVTTPMAPFIGGPGVPFVDVVVDPTTGIIVVGYLDIGGRSNVLNARLFLPDGSLFIDETIMQYGETYFLDEEVGFSISPTSRQRIILTVNTEGPDGFFHIYTQLWLLPQYLSPGVMESSVYDSGASNAWDPIQWTASNPSGTATTVEFRAGNTSTPDGSWTGYVPLPSGATPPAAMQGKQYIQYRATLTSNGVDTPRLYDVTVPTAGESHTFTYQVIVDPTTTPGTINQNGSIFSAQDSGVVSNTVSNPVSASAVSPVSSSPDSPPTPPSGGNPPPPPSSPPGPVEDAPPSNILEILLIVSTSILGFLSLINATGIFSGLSGAAAGLGAAFGGGTIAGAGITAASGFGIGVYTLGAVGVYLFYLFTEPLRALFGRNRKGWGVVYNALSKQPIDLALVRLFDADGKLLKTRISDRHGRFQFTIDKDQQVSMQVVKSGFTFPSMLLKNAKSDSAYTDLYYGKSIAVKANDAIIPNIPLDPPEIDGSTEAYHKRKKRLFWGKMISLTGSFLSIGTAILYPSALTIGLVILHVVLYAVFSRLARRRQPASWGMVTDATSKQPLPATIARIFDKQYDRLLDMTQSDARGRYAFLADKNIFYATFEHPDYVTETTPTIDLTAKKEGDVVKLDIPLKRA